MATFRDSFQGYPHQVKNNGPGKWRLIVGLPSPLGVSVSDVTSKRWSSLYYTSVDHLAALIVAAGRRSYLVKADVKEAYRNDASTSREPTSARCIVAGEGFHRQDVALWLAFRPKFFMAVTDALQWLFRQEGIENSLHCLDVLWLPFPLQQSARDSLCLAYVIP